MRAVARSSGASGRNGYMYPSGGVWTESRRRELEEALGVSPGAGAERRARAAAGSRKHPVQRSAGGNKNYELQRSLYRGLSYSDPYGLCADSLKNGDGKCPGDLTDEQWDAVEGAAKKMTPYAQRRVLSLLNAGQIHAGIIGDSASGETSILRIGTTINTNSRVGNVFENPTLLAHTLAHEARHVDDVRGMNFFERSIERAKRNYDPARQAATEPIAEAFACATAPAYLSHCR